MVSQTVPLAWGVIRGSRNNSNTRLFGFQLGTELVARNRTNFDSLARACALFFENPLPVSFRTLAAVASVFLREHTMIDEIGEKRPAHHGISRNQVLCVAHGTEASQCGSQPIAAV